MSGTDHEHRRESEIRLGLLGESIRLTGIATRRRWRLVNELAEQMRRGEPPQIDALLAQNPDLASELRPLWAAMLVTDCVAAGSRAVGSGRGRSSADGLTQDHSPQPSAAKPRRPGPAGSLTASSPSSEPALASSPTTNCSKSWAVVGWEWSIAPGKSV